MSQRLVPGESLSKRLEKRQRSVSTDSFLPRLLGRGFEIEAGMGEAGFGSGLFRFLSSTPFYDRLARMQNGSGPISQGAWNMGSNDPSI